MLSCMDAKYGSNSQLEGPTAAVLEDAVVAWHAELQGKESEASKEKHCHS